MNDIDSNNGQSRRTRVEIPKKEKTLLEIFQLIIKNKYILLTSIVVMLAIALTYSFTAEPKYEATAVLKKESNPEDRRLGAPDISQMLTLQSTDQIETDMQLITTNSVMSSVVDELDLFCTITELEYGNGKTYKVNKTYLDMLDPVFRSKNSDKFIVPNKLEIIIGDTARTTTGEYILKKDSEDSYVLLDAIDNKVLSKSEIKIDTSLVFDSLSTFEHILPIASLKFSDFEIKFNWKEAPINSRLLISFNDYNKVVIGVNKNVKVAREGKTDIFSITYSSSSATSAAIITNTIVDKYREARLNQKKDLIRYSFNFVDKQLNEIQGDLKKSEDQLSSFKASGQIMTIDASSQELVRSLSSLEAEKNATDMQLSDYKNRAAELEKELKKSGYFDQTGLGPQGSSGDGNSPFSVLMRQLADQELQRLDLLQKRTENHPDVKAIDEQISLTKSKLSSFNQNTITAYKIIINSLEKKLLKITDMMSKYEVKMRSLPAQENKLAQLMRERSTYERIFQILLDQREAMRVAELSSTQDITIVDEAKIPINPSWPKKSLILLVSLILGGFIGILSIFLLELYRTKFVNLDELETEFQTPILSIIPKYSKEIEKDLKNTKSEYKIASLVSCDEGLIETYRLFRTKLSQKLDPQKKIIMVTSCEENSGKTSIVANLAVSISQEGKKVLVVDCDLRKADLTKMFGLTTKDIGLIDFLTKDVNPKVYSRASKLIDVLPAGGLTDESGTILGSPRMKALFSHLAQSNYDVILFDTPPVTRVVDPLVIAHHIKDAILIVRPNHSLIETVRWGIQELHQAHVRIKGIVANAATIENSYYYRYRYGYGYGYGKDKKDEKKKLLVTRKAVENTKIST
ncbi:MAG: polysaccharide biosynthesis tyrosine autokinase [Ignavibacterium sp.]|nr:polysaccharide biosynthesis tyrosine autokinase [Ignavibacterium sp.]